MEKKRIISEFREISQKVVDLCGEPNISDVFPFLSRFDLQKKEHIMKNLMMFFDKIFDQVIAQSLKKKSGQKNMDFLEVLLQCRNRADQKNTPLTITHIKALLMVCLATIFFFSCWGIGMP